VPQPGGGEEARARGGRVALRSSKPTKCVGAPPEVAADPARLAVWKSNQPKPWSVEFFELGCGHRVLCGCRLPSKSSSAGVHALCPYTRKL
jgi:hypothetical protein